jgi:hypothetical protein
MNSWQGSIENLQQFGAELGGGSSSWISVNALDMNRDVVVGLSEVAIVDHRFNIIDSFVSLKVVSGKLGCIVHQICENSCPKHINWEVL